MIKKITNTLYYIVKRMSELYLINEYDIDTHTSERKNDKG